MGEKKEQIDKQFVAGSPAWPANLWRSRDGVSRTGHEPRIQSPAVAEKNVLLTTHGSPEECCVYAPCFTESSVCGLYGTRMCPNRELQLGDFL